jgi:hypothetical protein
MLFAGTLVSIVFIMGAFGNYKDENWLVAGLLTFAATAFIIVPPVITHRSLSPEAGRMVISEDDVDNAHGDHLSDTKPVVADAIGGTIPTLLEPPESSGSIVYEDAATRALSHLEDLFLTLLEAVPTNGQVKLDATSSAWLRPVLQAIVGFPWGETNLPDDRRPPQHAAAVELLLLLLRNLDTDTMAPTSVNPTGDGGATAQWHLPEYDLEIFCEPDQPPEYVVRTPDTEYQGQVRDEEERNRFRAHLALSPKRYKG